MSTRPNMSFVCEDSATNGRSVAPDPGCPNWLHGDYTPSKEFGYGRIRYNVTGNLNYTRLDIIKVKPGLELVLMALNPGDNRQICFTIQNAPIDISFCLSTCHADWFQRGPDLERNRIISRSDIAVVSYLPNTRGRVQLSGFTPVIGAGLQVAPALLSKYLDRDMARLPETVKRMLAGEKSFRHILALPMPPRAWEIVGRMMGHPCGNPMENLYFETRALELLFLSVKALSRCKEATGQGSSVLSRRDAGQICAARDILFKEFQNPPSLTSLARRVGTNECKLKWGFRKAFGTSAYQCLKKHRMDLARDMIETDINVSAAAQAVGYINVSHFITAFKQRHGITPGRLRQSLTEP